MSLQKTLIKVATGYAIKKITEEMTADDARRYASQAQEYAMKAAEMTPEEWRRSAWSGLDSTLLRAGLMRRANMTSPTALVFGGVALGVAIGAGAAYVYASPELRAQFMKTVEEFLPSNREQVTAYVDGEVQDVAAPIAVEAVPHRSQPNAPRS